MTPTPELTPIQRHILQHCRHGRYYPAKTVDENISAFNQRCLTGMIETGEANWDDLRDVGGDALVAQIAKEVQRYASGG